MTRVIFIASSGDAEAWCPIFLPPQILALKIIDRLRRAYRIRVKMGFGTDTVIEVPNKSRADLMLGYLPV